MTSATSTRRRGLTGHTTIKSPVIAASTANLTLSAEQTVDGIALVAGDRVLVKDQTDGTENGIYLVATSTWAREPDWDGVGDVVEGTMTQVNRGTINALTWWLVSNTGTITPGTTDVTFVRGLTDVGISAMSTVTDESSDTTCFPVFVTAATGNNALKSGSNLTFNSSTGEVTATGFTIGANTVTAWASSDNVADNFPAGTAMLFYQATAPTGWTESGAALENHALRVCSVAGYAAAGGTGTQGTNTFDAVLSDARNAGATTLTSAQSGLPAHTHAYDTSSTANGGNAAFATSTTNAGELTGIITANAAANASSSHTHTLDFAIKYANIIICAKD